MTSETIKLNLIPGGELPVLHASQFDDGRALSFEIYDGDEAYASYAAYNISLHLRKVDGTIIGIDTFTIDDVNDCVVFTTTEQMTACAGKNIGELVFTDSLSGVVVGSCNFILEVEPDPYAGGIDSASDIENLSTQIAAIVDGQLDNYYTKEEIDDQIETIVTQQVTPIVSGIVSEQVPPIVASELTNYYTKAETDSAFYNKSAVDTLLSGKADTSDLPDMTDYYDKTTTDTLLASKANTSTTYTKTEVDNLIASITSNDITTEITTPASVQTFNDGGDNIPLKALVTEIVPIQSGSGVPSPQNVRAITGHSNVNVYDTAKNFFDSEGLLNATGWVKNANGSYTGNNKDISQNQGFSADSNCLHNFFDKSDYGVNYTFSIVFNENPRLYIVFKIVDRQGTERTKSSGDITTSGAYSITSDCTSDERVYGFYFSFGTNKSITISNLQLEQGTTPTTYQAFGNITTIPLGSTVYGGSLECVEGSGTDTLEKVNLSDLTWHRSSQGYRFYATLPSGYPWQSGLTMYCSCFAFDGVGNAEQGYYGAENTIRYYFNPNNNPSYELYVRTTVDTVEDLQSLLSGQTFVYPKLTPTSISVTGANIPTLSGLNNVYTDCGDIQSLEYFNDNADDIAAMISLMTRS